MWQSLNTDFELQTFMDEMSGFHDACIKEIAYLSGAYVNADLSMHPFNDRGVLRVLIQRQIGSHAMVEMEFGGLKYLKLFPVDADRFTCEISGSSLFLKDGLIYWSDEPDIIEANLGDDVTIICAKTLRWRPIEGHMGPAEFYRGAE